MRSLLSLRRREIPHIAVPQPASLPPIVRSTERSVRHVEKERDGWQEALGVRHVRHQLGVRQRHRVLEEYVRETDTGSESIMSAWAAPEARGIE